MSVELQTYGGDRRLVLGAAEAIRKPIYGADWNVLRIGLHYTFNGVQSNVSGTPALYIGACSGDSGVIVPTSTLNAVGFKLTASTFTHNLTAGGESYLYLPSHVNILFTKVGSTEATSATGFSSSAKILNNNPLKRGFLFVQIEKGSPNFQIRVMVGAFAASLVNDYTDEDFRYLMEVDPFTSITASPYDSSIGTVQSTTTGLPVDEVTNGALDHIFLYWPRTSHKFTFNLRHRKVS